MNALVIYDSTFGNTQQIAQAIARVLREHGNVGLHPVQAVGTSRLKEIDLLVLGCPTQNYSLTPAVRAFLANIPASTQSPTTTRNRSSSWGRSSPSISRS